MRISLIVTIISIISKFVLNVIITKTDTKVALNNGNYFIQSQDETNSLNLICKPQEFLELQYKSQCISCPYGHECLEKDIIWPKICKEGLYRSNSDKCIPCPKGMYNFEKGSKNIYDCIPCPPGKNCPYEKTNKPYMIKECAPGLVCDFYTGLVEPLKCPNGYICVGSNTPENKFENKCPPGFICKEGSYSEEFATKCPKNFYCPSGSKFYVSESERLTRCPLGTFTLSAASMFMIECIPEKPYNILTNLPFNRLLYQLKYFDYVDSGSRDENNVLAITEKNYYEKIYNINLINLKQKSLLNSPPIEGFNYNRKRILKINPLKTVIGHQPVQTEVLFTDFNNKPQEFNYYQIEKNSYALITFDLRHLSKPDNYFLYGIDWDINIEKFYKLNSDVGEIIEMPELFLNKTTKISKVHEFNLYSLEEIFIKISVNIYNGRFHYYGNFFLDTAIIQVTKPNRAILGTSNFFAIILKPSSKVEFPINLPILDYTKNLRNLKIGERIKKDFVSYASTDLSIKNERVQGLNSFPQLGFYWGSSDMMGIPFLPFFSNCKGYGKYIPLWALVEQNQKCELVEKENTKFATNLSFGMDVISDKCDILLECIYDEEIDLTIPFWYNAKTGTYLFSLTEDSINIDEIFDVYSQNDITDVYVNSNNLPNNSIPGTVELKIHYYQKSDSVKKIVAAELNYLDPIKISEIENKWTIPYKLHVVYAPLSHTKLMVSFSLTSYFYILLYIIQGFIDLILVLVFFIFHKYMSRITPIPTYKHFSYLSLMIPHLIYGFLLAMIPICFVLLIITVAISGKMMSCDEIGMTSEKCYISLFDYIPYLGKDQIDTKTLRMSRVGTALLAMGAYLLYKASKLMTPDEPTYYISSYDRNSWNILNWKIQNFVCINFFILCVFLYFTVLSFSSVWGQNFWLFIHIFKIVGIILEIYLKSTLQDQLLISGVPCIFNIVQGLLTFGASDYVDFLNSSYVELISLSVERLYLEPLIFYVQENWNFFYKSIVDYIRKMLQLDIELLEEQKSEYHLNGYNDPIFLNNVNDINSEIENSKTNKNSPNLGEESKNKIIAYDVQENSDASLLENLHFDASSINNIKDLDNKFNIEYESTRYKFLKKMLPNNKKTKKMVEIKIEILYDKYKVFSADLLTLFFNMPFILFMWFYYDETKIFSLYNITQSNFVYFYYFILISPFYYITADIFFHNMLGYYYGTKMHEFLDYMNYRFSTRKTSWVLDDKTINTKIDPEFRKLDKLCFSSQYYFIMTIYSSGVCFGLIGITTVILNNSNLFGDIASAPIIAFIFIICYLVEKACKWIGKFFKIWQISIEEKDKQSLLNSYTAKKISKTRVIGRLENPPNIKPIKNWDVINYIKEKQEIIEENLKTERMVQDHIRRQFLNENRIWLRESIGTILSPRTLYLNKERVIEAIKNRYKIHNTDHFEKHSDYNESHSKISEKNSESSIHNSSKLSENDLRYHKSIPICKKYKDPFSKENKSKKIKEGYEKRNVIGKILKSWMLRGKSSLEIFNLVRLAIHHSRKDKCDKCNSKILLRSICVTPILKIFDKFLTESGSSFDDYDPVLFKIYFLEKANIITLCSNCQK